MNKDQNQPVRPGDPIWFGLAQQGNWKTVTRVMEDGEHVEAVFVLPGSTHEDIFSIFDVPSWVLPRDLLNRRRAAQEIVLVRLYEIGRALGVRK